MQSLPDYLALLIFTIATFALVGGMLIGAWWLGNKKGNPNKAIAYESGVVPTGTARIPLFIPFYLVAIFFIVFDVEAAFIFTWAVAWDQMGVYGMLHMTFFIVALLLGLIWIWLKGGLEWGPSRMRGREDER